MSFHGGIGGREREKDAGRRQEGKGRIVKDLQDLKRATGVHYGYEIACRKNER